VRPTQHTTSFESPFFAGRVKKASFRIADDHHSRLRQTIMVIWQMNGFCATSLISCAKHIIAWTPDGAPPIEQGSQAPAGQVLDR
jgi:hypothetical protein